MLRSRRLEPVVLKKQLTCRCQRYVRSVTTSSKCNKRHFGDNKHPELKPPFCSNLLQKGGLSSGCLSQHVSSEWNPRLQKGQTVRVR